MAKLEWKHFIDVSERFPDIHRTDRSFRAEIPGGWLVKVLEADGVGLTFVPDPKHEWK